jgi:hypothetical protein
MLLVVAPFDQRYPLACDDVSVRTVPGQTFSVPLAVTVGTAGAAFASTTTGVEVPEQLPPPVVTVKDPEVDTVIDCVVAPFDHWYDEAVLQDNVTLLPGQNAVGPDVVTTGAVPVPAFVTTAAAEVAFVPDEFVTRTV